MRTAVVVTLILVGALLIITPVVAGLWHEANLVRLFQEPSAANRTIGGEGISETYSLGCWFTGTGMIAVSILLAAWFSRQAP